MHTLKTVLALFFLSRAVSLSFLAEGTIVNTVYVLISKIVALWEVGWYFTRRAHKKRINLQKDSVFILICVYFFYLLVNSLFQGANIRRIIMSFYPIIGTVALIDNEWEYHAKEFLRGTFWYFFIIISANLFDMIVFRNALHQQVIHYMIGGRNQLAIPLAMALGFTLNRPRDGRKSAQLRERLLDIALIFITGLSAFISSSATALCSIAVLIFLLMVYDISGKAILSPKLYGILYVGAWFSLVIFRLHTILEPIIVDYLHKDLTLTNRTIIWDSALNAIEKKPIVGYGNPDTYNVFRISYNFLGYPTNEILSGHNQIVQMLYYGGLLMVLIFAVLYVCSCGQSAGNRRSYLFFLSTIPISITWMSEVPGEYAMFVMLAMCFYSSYIFVKEENADGLPERAACMGRFTARKKNPEVIAILSNIYIS